MLTKEQLAEWQKLCDAASKGPWEATASLMYNSNYRAGTGPWIVNPEDDHIDDPRVIADAAFIAAARTAMPELIRYVISRESITTQVIDDLKAEVERLRDERSCECCRNYQCDCLK